MASNANNENTSTNFVNNKPLEHSKSNSNLVDELEEAFQNCIHALTKEEPGIGEENTDIKQDVDQTTLRFIDLVCLVKIFKVISVIFEVQYILLGSSNGGVFSTETFPFTQYET